MILLNNKPVHQWKFPGGEIGVKVYPPSENGLYHIDWKGIPTSDDLMVLLQTVDALSLAGIAPEKIAVYIPYLPYARQDRACHKGESFSLEVFVRVLKKNGEFVLEDQLPDDGAAEDESELAIVFYNGFVFDQEENTLEKIRARIKEQVPD